MGRHADRAIAAYGPLSDDLSDIVERARNGDPAAAAALYERFEDEIRHVARRRLNSWLRCRHDSGDILQSVFREVLCDLGRFEFRGEPAFRHWLALKTVNKVRTKFRHHLGPDGRGRTEELVDRPDPHESRNPVRALLRQEEGDRVRGALRDLDEPDREVIELRLRDGLSHARVAERLGLPSEEAARKRYARALVRLRERWKRID